MATEIQDAETQALRDDTSAYVLELRLESGETLATDAGTDPEAARAQLAAIQAAVGDMFVYAGRDVVVRSSEISYARLRTDDGQGEGLLESIKQRVGGGSRMTMYETENRGSRVRVRNQWDDGDRG